MIEENLNKKIVEVSPFLDELYNIKYQLEELIIKLEKIKGDE